MGPVQFLPEKKTTGAYSMESAHVSVPTFITGSGLQRLCVVRHVNLPFLGLLLPRLSSEVITPAL